MPRRRRRKFSRPRLPGINGPLGRYVIRISEDGIYAESQPESLHSTPRDPFKFKGQLSPLKPLTNHLMTLKSGPGGEMRLINFEFRSMDQESEPQRDKLPPLTTTLTFSDFLCKWCLTYIGQRRQFCSADCAAQFKLCQRRRDEKQNLNISVDYYGNVKLSIQGLPLNAGEGIEVTKSYPGGTGVSPRRSRRRKRCKNCAKLLKHDHEDEYCDETCRTMDGEKNKREDFVNVFQQKEIAERRRIRKWLLDAQDQYTKQQGDGADPYIVGEGVRMDGEYPSRSGGPTHLTRRYHYVQEPRFRLNRDEVITGGPVTLNPTPLRRGPLRTDRHRHGVDSEKRQVMIDLAWIPKFHP